MQFPKARKYTNGFLTPVKKDGKEIRGKYKLTLKFKDDAGNWHSKPSKVVEAKTKTEAKKLLQEFQEEQEKKLRTLPVGASTNNRDLTIEEAVRSYLSYQKDTVGDLESSTYKIQMNNMEKRCFPYIGNIVFSSLDVMTINEWWTTLSNQGLSQAYIRKIFSTLQKVYSYHYKTGDITYNPFEHLTKKPSKSNYKVTRLTPENTEKLLAALNEEYSEEDEMWIAINLALLGGLRRGEIVALRWVDVDFERNKLSISSAVGYGEEGEYTKQPKNRSSARTFTITPQLRECLAARYKVCGNPPNDWYVCGNDGKRMSLGSISVHFKRLVDKYNLVDAFGAHLTLHALRHNFASLAVASNIDIKTIQTMLGHGSASMTLDVYATLDSNAMAAGAELLGQAFGEQTDYLEDVPPQEDIERAIEILRRAGYDTSKLVKVNHVERQSNDKS